MVNDIILCYGILKDADYTRINEYHTSMLRYLTAINYEAFKYRADRTPPTTADIIELAKGLEYADELLVVEKLV